MDKKTEIRRRQALQTAAAAAAPDGWWMYHGDPAHTGYVAGGNLNSTTVASASFQALFTLQLGGPVLSVPAISNGFIYVGLANAQAAQGGNGGELHKIEIATGKTVATFEWNLGSDTRDVHSFTGMGCTPAVIGGRVYFGAFNGKMYCLDANTLKQLWVTDLRNADLPQNQPVTNTAGVAAGAPAAVIWSSPVVSADGANVYVGCGEGENPDLNSFVFCLDTATGKAKWIFCTNKFSATADNQPNHLPSGVLSGSVPPQYTPVSTTPLSMGCSVWGAIAYDAELNRLYCSTGNQQPEPNDNWPGWPNWTPQSPLSEAPPFVPELPSPGYSNGVLSLDASTGAVKAFFQVPIESNYRPSDTDIDLGGAPTIHTLNGKKVVSVGCKNGSCFVLDAASLKLIKQRQMLPYHTDHSTIDTVDAHPSPDSNDINPHVPSAMSDLIPNENFSGVFNTGAVHPGQTGGTNPFSPRIFYAMGGPNYHNQSPGIDHESTPFMRAIDLSSPTLDDAWPLDNGDPRRYTKTQIVDPVSQQQIGMYASAGESGLSSPAIVNDVVFCTTSKVSIYAFSALDGTLLWHDDLGAQTDGYNGGYGYCLGPAIWRNYVVAGGLIFGRDGGVLKIYGLATS
jgi:outer membrane protein assembly factor BamB